MEKHTPWFRKNHKKRIFCDFYLFLDNIIYQILFVYVTF